MTSRAPALEEVLDRGEQAAAGREHRVEHEALAVGEVRGQALGVDRRLERLLVADHPEEAHLGGRDQLHHPLEHPETGAQDRYDERQRGWRARAPCVIATGVSICTGVVRTARVAS